MYKAFKMTVGSDDDEVTAADIERLPIEETPFTSTLQRDEETFPHLNDRYNIFAQMSLHDGKLEFDEIFWFQPKELDKRFYRPVKWYRDALKNAVLMEDFEEAAALKSLIKQLES